MIRTILFILSISACVLLANPQPEVIQADWSEAVYYNSSNGNGWGPGGRPTNPVPEPASYGFFCMGASLSYLLLRRPKR